MRLNFDINESLVVPREESFSRDVIDSTLLTVTPLSINPSKVDKTFNNTLYSCSSITIDTA